MSRAGRPVQSHNLHLVRELVLWGSPPDYPVLIALPAAFRVPRFVIFPIVPVVVIVVFSGIAFATRALNNSMLPYCRAAFSERASRQWSSGQISFHYRNFVK